MFQKYQQQFICNKIRISNYNNHNQANKNNNNPMFRLASRISVRMFSTTPAPIPITPIPVQAVSAVAPVSPVSVVSPLGISPPPLTIDLSNATEFINASSTPTLSFWQKISYFTPGSLYHSLDEFSREFLFTLAHDYQLGLPVAVIAISCLLRLAFFYPNMKGQIGAIKMKQIKPFMDRFKQKARIAQMTRNTALMKSARDQLKAVQKQKGIDNFYAFVNIIQIPFLITWFLSLRYVAALPEIYPSVTEGFLWVKDLSTYDPYFLLPLISAVLSSFSITISPGLKNANVMPIMEPFVKYLKYLPILSLPITGFFPAILNLYWCTLAINQALLMMAMNSKFVYNWLDTSVQKKGHSHIQKAVFIEEKPVQNAKKAEKVAETKSNEAKKVQAAPQIAAETIKILSKKPKKAKKVQKN